MIYVTATHAAYCSIAGAKDVINLFHERIRAPLNITFRVKSTNTFIKQAATAASNKHLTHYQPRGGWSAWETTKHCQFCMRLTARCRLEHRGCAFTSQMYVQNRFIMCQPEVHLHKIEKKPHLSRHVYREIIAMLHCLLHWPVDTERITMSH